MKVILLLIAILSACPNYVIAQNLIGGKLTKDFPEVIAIRSGNGFCSSTLISPDILITAAHCIDEKTNQIKVYGSSNIGDCLVSEYYQTENHLDLALCKLKQKIEIKKYPRVAREDEFPKIDSRIVLTGYGCKSDKEYDYKLRAGFAITTKYEKNTYWTYRKSSKQGTLCFGDSGSGSFKYIKDPKNDDHVILGVNSMGDIKRISIMVALGSQTAQNFINEFINKYDSDLCGFNVDCD